MAKRVESFKTAKARIWSTGNVSFTSKRAAYRHCRTLNGKKSGGRRPYKVERKNA
jgi:hypothetical protein